MDGNAWITTKAFKKSVAMQDIYLSHSFLWVHLTDDHMNDFFYWGVDSVSRMSCIAPTVSESLEQSHE